MRKIYAGVGSRWTPPAVLDVMTAAADRLAGRGWTVRTGGAQGADQTFWRAAATVDPGSVELYLPWDHYEGFHDYAMTDPQPEAFEIAAKYHPAWGRLSQGAEKLHARNVHIMLGPDVTKPDLVDFVLCWTRHAKMAGGTGQALRIAEAYDVPVYNLGDDLQFIVWSDILHV